MSHTLYDRTHRISMAPWNHLLCLNLSTIFNFLTFFIFHYHDFYDAFFHRPPNFRKQYIYEYMWNLSIKAKRRGIERIKLKYERINQRSPSRVIFYVSSSLTFFTFAAFANLFLVFDFFAYPSFFWKTDYKFFEFSIFSSIDKSSSFSSIEVSVDFSKVTTVVV